MIKCYNFQNDLTMLKDFDLEKTTVYGYNIRDLALFADACRRSNITEEQLSDFAKNVKCAYEYADAELEKFFQEQMNKYLKNVFIGEKYDEKNN